MNIPHIAVSGYAKASKYLMNIIRANWDDYGGSTPSCLAGQCEILTRCTLLTTVK